MLKSLSIKNFQSHADTAIELADGVNVLVGTSDSGKSAVLRALCWLATNRPRGTSFIRHGSDGECRVTLETVAGTVSRVRSKTANAYMLDGSPLEAMGADVPKPIADLLNLAEINIAGQFDGHFLLADSPGAIAKAVNDAAHLEEAEVCATTLASSHKAVLAEIRDLQARRSTINGDLRHFDNLPEYRAVLEAAIALEANVARIRGILAGLSVLVDSVRGADFAIKSLGEPVDWQGACIIAENLVAGNARDYDRLDRLTAVVRHLAQAEGELSALPDIDAGLLDAVTMLDADRRWTWTRLDNLDILLNDIDGAKERISKADREMEYAQTVYDKELTELTVCPTCGQELDEVTKKAVLENAR